MSVWHYLKKEEWSTSDLQKVLLLGGIVLFTALAVIAEAYEDHIARQQPDYEQKRVARLRTPKQAQYKW